MKIKYFLFSILALVCLLPQTSFAVAEYQNFSASLTLNANCNPIVTYNATITPASITTGNTFILGVYLSNQQGVLQSQNGVNVGQDYPISVPANGVISDATVSLTVQVVEGAYYSVRIHEYGQDQSYVGSSTAVVTQPTNTGCLSVPPGGVANPATDGINTDINIDIDVQNPISVNSVPQLIQKVLEILIKIGIPLLVVMIVYSGALYLLAMGNPKKIQDAHTMLIYTLIGGAILLGAWAIAQLIYATLIDLTASLITIFV